MYGKKNVTIFLMGCLCGFMLSSLYTHTAPLNFVEFIFTSVYCKKHIRTQTPLQHSEAFSTTYQSTIMPNKMKNGYEFTTAETKFVQKSTELKQTSKHTSNRVSASTNLKDFKRVSESLEKSEKVLCMVLTYPGNHRAKADHVQNTWGRRCNKIIYVSDTPDPYLPEVLVVTDSQGRSGLSRKTSAAFDLAYSKYLNSYQWFMKADDDTYVILENLRYFLSKQNTSSAVYFGHLFVPYMKQGYHSGGGGYVLSREAVRRFGERSKNGSDIQCTFNSGVEDKQIGHCMESLGVRAAETIDEFGRTTFHCFSLEHHLAGFYPAWFRIFDKYKGKKMGPSSISNYAITFHYVEPEALHLMDFLIYGLRPYGIFDVIN